MNARFARIAAWIAGLVVVTGLASALVTGQQLRAKGLPEGFPDPVPGADVPQLGVNVALEQYDDERLDAALHAIARAGITWVRQPFYWSEVEPATGHFDWAPVDRIVDAVARHPELRLIAVLEDQPPAPPEEPERFAAFAGAFGARYGDRIDDYQIWDEPNLASHWGGDPVSPPAYADLLARSARAIRAADGLAAAADGPEARILLAGLAPTAETGPQNVSDVRYLELLYQAGAAPYFDVAVGKPYGFDTGPGDRRADDDVLNFSRLILLREVMERNGDGHKAVWASHWGWNALPPGWSGAPSIWGQTDLATHAARTVAALDRARAEWPWAGALVLEHYQPLVEEDDARWGFALVGPDDVARPVFGAVAAWSRTFPDAAPVGGFVARNRWARYEGAWQVGPLGADIGADGDRASFRFEGTSVALTVRRGPYRANLYVTVDGSPANALPRSGDGRAFIVLYDDASRVSTVPLATHLDPGTHTVEVVAERGWDQWAIVDWRVAPAPATDGSGWRLASLGGAALVLVALLARDVRRADWAAVGDAYLRWPEWRQAGLGAAMTVLAWAAAAGALSLLSSSGTSPWRFVGLGVALIGGGLASGALTLLFGLRPDLALGLAAATAPFYLIPGGMAYRAVSATEAILILCAAGIAFRRRLVGKLADGDAVRLSAMDWAVVGYLASAAVGTAFAPDTGSALLELKMIFALPTLFYMLLRIVRPGRESIRRIVAGWALGAALVAIIGLAQYALGVRVVLAEGGLARLRSVYYSPNSVALYLGRVWPVLVAGAILGRGRRLRWCAGICLAVLTLALVLSFSRGALLFGIPAAILLMGVWAGGRYRWAAVAAVAAGALALIPLMTVPRFASLLDVGRGSTFFRLELWRSTIAMIRDHPLLGVGPGQFAEAYHTRYVLPAAWSEPTLTHPHNIVLDHWTRLGIPGLAAGIAIQWAFWRTTWLRGRGSDEGGRRRDALMICLGGSMAALLAHGLVDNTVFSPDMAMAFFLTLGLAHAGAAWRQADEESAVD